MMRYQREVIERLEQADALLAEAQSMCEVDKRNHAKAIGSNRIILGSVKNRVQNEL